MICKTCNKPITFSATTTTDYSNVDFSSDVCECAYPVLGHTTLEEKKHSVTEGLRYAYPNVDDIIEKGDLELLKAISEYEKRSIKELLGELIQEYYNSIASEMHPSTTDDDIHIG